jgi:hypothetical protein
LGKQLWRLLATELSLFAWLGHLNVDLGLLTAIMGLDKEAQKTLKEYSAPFGVDVTQWKSNRLGYLKDAYSVFAFLAVWFDEQGLTDLLDQFGDILKAGIFAVSGYGILHEDVDGDNPSPNACKRDN